MASSKSATKRLPESAQLSDSTEAAALRVNDADELSRERPGGQRHVVNVGVVGHEAVVGPVVDDRYRPAGQQFQRQERQIGERHDEGRGAPVVQRRQLLEFHRPVIDVVEGHLPVRHVPSGHVDADVGATLLHVG